MGILDLLNGALKAYNAWAQKAQQAHDEENGANKITVINQEKVLEDVQIAQHVRNDVPIDGKLADWVRERAAKTSNG